MHSNFASLVLVSCTAVRALSLMAIRAGSDIESNLKNRLTELDLDFGNWGLQSIQRARWWSLSIQLGIRFPFGTCCVVSQQFLELYERSWLWSSKYQTNERFTYLQLVIVLQFLFEAHEWQIPKDFSPENIRLLQIPIPSEFSTAEAISLLHRCQFYLVKDGFSTERIVSWNWPVQFWLLKLLKHALAHRQG